MLPLGSTLCFWRQARGLTQAELASRAGVSRPNLSMIEQEARDLTVGTLKRLAEALQVRPGVLVDGIPPKPLASQRLSRESLDRIARWVARKKRGRPRFHLTEEEKTIAVWIESLAKHQVNLTAGRGRRLPRTVRRERQNFLEAKMNLGVSQIRNLLSRVQKAAQGIS